MAITSLLAIPQAMGTNGLDSPDGRGISNVCLRYVIWRYLDGYNASMNIFNPLAMGEGKGGMLVATLTPLVEYFPEQAKDIQALTSSANLMYSIPGLYIYIIFLPFTSWLYDTLKGSKINTDITGVN